MIGRAGRAFGTDLNRQKIVSSILGAGKNLRHLQTVRIGGDVGRFFRNHLAQINDQSAFNRGHQIRRVIDHEYIAQFAIGHQNVRAVAGHNIAVHANAGLPLNFVKNGAAGFGIGVERGITVDVGDVEVYNFGFCRSRHRQHGHKHDQRQQQRDAGSLHRSVHSLS